MKKYKLTITLTTLALFASLLSGCFGNNNNAADSTQITSGNSSQYETLEPLSQTYFIFDTVVNVKIYDTRATKDNLQDIENILKNIDQKLAAIKKTVKYLRSMLNQVLQLLKYQKIRMISSPKH